MLSLLVLLEAEELGLESRKNRILFHSDTIFILKSLAIHIESAGPSILSFIRMNYLDNKIKYVQFGPEYFIHLNIEVLFIFLLGQYLGTLLLLIALQIF